MEPPNKKSKLENKLLLTTKLSGSLLIKGNLNTTRGVGKNSQLTNNFLHKYKSSFVKGNNNFVKLPESTATASSLLTKNTSGNTLLLKSSRCLNNFGLHQNLKSNLALSVDTKPSLLKSSNLLSLSTGVNKTASPLSSNITHHSYSASSSLKKPFGQVGKEHLKCLDTNRLRDTNEISFPEYEFEHIDHDEDEVAKSPLFIPFEKDPSISSSGDSSSLLDLKLNLVNASSGSLIALPDFRNMSDPVCSQLVKLARSVSNYDPEFVLKVALYTRRELNIRSTANFLLALAAHDTTCRVYLKKYYGASICLPSDWIEVAEFYDVIASYEWGTHGSEGTYKHGVIPAKLRECMTLKFPDFDQYQLAKYNKEKSRIQKRKMNPKKDVSRKRRYGQENQTSILQTSEQSEIASYTIKQLIRKLHISEPVENVMCLIGKRYPDSFEGFVKSKMSGEWDSGRGGKRMKLPTPETWETQVSLKGNKASTWEQLIDNKKLPYMAMLRNLRNLICAGISQKHHNIILTRLSDEKSVINSKQFPFRFFSAYTVLTTLRREYTENQQNLVSQAVTRCRAIYRGIRGRRRGAGKQWWQMRQQDKPVKEVKYDEKLIDRYKRSLDDAVKVATVHNMQPISGRTVILCRVTSDTDSYVVKSAGGSAFKKYNELTLLLGLMCKYSCESCDLIVYNDNCSFTLDIGSGTILDNLEKALNACLTPEHDYPSSPCQKRFPSQRLYNYINTKVHIDNLILVTFETDGDVDTRMTYFLEKYRHLVNPHLLYVLLTLKSDKTGFSPSKEGHPNDIHLTGFSDQILRFIAERRCGNQLTNIEKIDEAYQLISLTVNKKPKINHEHLRRTLSGPKTRLWRDVRVFISSTFKDMHGERDLLSRFIFPELRARALRHCINLYEIDLRWGVTEEETRNKRSVEKCLSEVCKATYYIGIFGERYGWIPEVVPSDDGGSELNNLSLTELELKHALDAADEPNEQIFLYFRNPAFLKKVPVKYHREFCSENDKNKEKLDKLKSRMRESGVEVFDGYPCDWGGVVEGCPIVCSLEEFGKRVLNNIWTALQRDFPILAEENESKSLDMQHLAAMLRMQSSVVNRPCIKLCHRLITTTRTGFVAVIGKPGVGKSSTMASSFARYIREDRESSVMFIHIVGCVPGSENVASTLSRFLRSLCDQFGFNFEIPSNYRNLLQKFLSVLAECSTRCTSRLVFYIDGADAMSDEENPHDLHWIPHPLPKNVVFVMSASEGGICHKALQKRSAAEVHVGPLELLEKSELVKCTLALHGKTLDESAFNQQMQAIVSKREATNPLYLAVACEEIRYHRIFEELTQKLKSLPPTLPSLLQKVLERLELDLGYDLISWSLSLLSLSRIGLSEGDLYSLLSLLLSDRTQQDLSGSSSSWKHISVLDLWHRFESERSSLPKLKFSFIYEAIKSFVRPATKALNRVRVIYSVIDQAIVSRYLKTNDRKYFFHKILAGYYLYQADPSCDITWSGLNKEAFSELPFHLMSCGAFEDLKVVLCDLQFIRVKADFGLGSQLLSDYHLLGCTNKIIQRDYEKFMNDARVRDYYEFLTRNLHIISKYPSLVYQQAVNSDPSSHTYAESQWYLSDIDDLCVIRTTNRSSTNDPCMFSISDLPSVVTSVGFNSSGTQFVCGDGYGELRLYDVLTGKELRTYRGHSDAITSVVFVTDRCLASGSSDCTISLWDVSDGHRMAILKRHRRKVTGVIADANKGIVVSSSWDCRTIVWNSKDGKLVSELYGDSRPLSCLAFHPDGHQIVSGGWDTTLRIWDIFNKRRIAILRGHESSIRAVAFSPDGRHIVSADVDGEVKMWWAKTGAQVGSVRGHSDSITCLRYSPVYDQLISASNDRNIKVWSGHLGTLIKTLGTKGQDMASAVAIHNGILVAVGYHSGLLRLYYIATGDVVHEILLHSARIRSVRFVGDGVITATGGDDGQTNIFSLHQHQSCNILSLSKPVQSLATCSSYIASGSEDFFVYIHFLPSASKLQTELVTTLVGHESPVTSCSFNNDETLLASASRDATILLWDVKDFEKSSEISSPKVTLPFCHSDWITDCHWSNIGNTLVTSSNDFNLKVWDMSTYEEKTTLTGHRSSVNTAAYKFGCIVSGCASGEVKIWSHKGIEITTLRGHTSRINSCDIHVTQDKNEVLIDKEMEDAEKVATAPRKQRQTRDGTFSDVVVATCSDDGTVCIWEPMKAKELQCLSGHSGAVISVDASKTGHLVTSSLDHSVKLWLPSKELQKTAHDASVTSLAYSLTSHMLLSASSDGSIKIWFIDEQGCLSLKQTIQADKLSVNTLCFLDSKGQMFAAGSSSGIMYVYGISQEDKTPAKCQSELNAGDSVLSIVWNHHRKDRRTFYLSKANSTYIHQWYLSRIEIQKKFKIANKGQWITNMKVCETETKLLAVTSDGCIWIIDAIQQNLQELACVGKWLTDVIFDPLILDSVLTGGCDGTISSIPRHDSPISHHKVHSDAITCLAVVNDTIVTGSRDFNIKLWSSDFKQVGLMPCQSPVTALAKADRGVFCGDQLGNVHSLQWSSRNLKK